MLEDAAKIRRVVMACGYVDLRKGIDGLAKIVGDQYKLNPFEAGTLFLFCGRRSDRMKGLLWMGTGFLLLYKRWEDGRLSWPRNTQDAAELTEEGRIIITNAEGSEVEVTFDDVIENVIYWGNNTFIDFNLVDEVDAEIKYQCQNGFQG